MWSQHVVFFKGNEGTKVKTPAAGKNKSRRALQASTWRDFAASHISQSKVHDWSPTHKSLCT
jgi:hypothetical protein